MKKVFDGEVVKSDDNSEPTDGFTQLEGNSSCELIASCEGTSSRDSASRLNCALSKPVHPMFK